MTWYTYPILPAIDPTTGLPVRNAEGQVYATSDTSFTTPLTVTDLSGVSLSGNIVKVTDQGVTTQFRVQDNPECVWKSGSYVLGLSSPQGMREAAEAAQVAAEAAATDAADAATNAQAAADAFATGAVPLGGATGQVLAKASATDRDVTWIDPPAGSGGGNVLVLGDSDAVPPGTLANTVIVRVAGLTPPPATISLLTGTGNVTTVGGNGTSALTATVPANAAVGDVLIAYLGSQSSAAGDTWTASSGWTVHYVNPAGRRIGIATYPIVDSAALTALGGTTSFTPPNTTGSSRTTVALQRATGVDLTTPFLGHSSPVAGTSSDATSPSFTTASSAGAVINFVETNNSSGTTPANVTVSGLVRAIGYTYVHTDGGQTGLWADWKVTTGTSHAAQTAVASPVSTASIVGFQFALKGA